MLLRIALAVSLAGASRAQEVAVRAWSVRDGLAQQRVEAIRRDAHGFLWFATWDGVSRFDGREFTSYGTREGLPNPLVWCVAEDRDGVVWLGTHGGGVARVASTGVAVLADPIGPSNPATCVFDISFDGDGRTWLVTNQGLYVGERDGAKRLHFERQTALAPSWFGLPLADGGKLRYVAGDELVACRGREVERAPIAHFGRVEQLGELRAVFPRRAGGAWVAHQQELHVLDTSATPSCRRVDLDFGANVSLYDVCEDASGRAWVATSRGLARVDGNGLRWYASAQGLPDDWIRTVVPDDSGALWIGTHQGGAALISDPDAVRFTARGGLGDGHAVELVTVAPDRWLVTTEVAGIFSIADGGVRLVEGSDRPPFDRLQRDVAGDSAGDLWLGTESGVYATRVDAPDLAYARRIGADRGLPPTARHVLGLDAAGSVLVSSADGRVFAHEPGAARFEELPFSLDEAPINRIAVSRAGTAWCSEGRRLWRSRGSELEPIAPAGVADPSPRVIFFDARGGLWIGTRFAGVFHAREPDAAAPAFERLTTREGLASDVVFAIAEAPDGAMYFGTGRGVQRRVPATGGLESVGAGDSSGWVTDLAFDARGDLWVATAEGVERLPIGAARAAPAPPRVRFTRCVVAGAELALPATGAFAPDAIEVDARDSRLAFDYVAVDCARGDRLRYETRLEGLDDGWSAPTRDLSVRYGALAPGTYRFAVRSVDPAAGVTSDPSFLAIEVVPAIWGRPWFLAAVALAIAALALAVQRARLVRERALERVRAQIAGDLHDDLGAGLARIAIASELARRAPPEEARATLGELAQSARDLRASMGDLVWAVDPRQGTLEDVVARMRHFAGDALAASGPSVEFLAPPADVLARVRLAPDARRNLLLFLKESATNAARHARARNVRIELAVEAGRLRLEVADDGAGFDARTVRPGRGIANLERRARELGGRATVESVVGRGTRVVLDAPM